MRRIVTLVIAILTIATAFAAVSFAQTEITDISLSEEEEVIELSSSTVDLAVVVAALDSYRQAAEAYRDEIGRLRKADPRIRDAAEGLVRNLQGAGMAHYLLNQSKEAIAAYEEAVKVSNDLLGAVDNDLIWKRAQAYGLAGNHRRVIEELEPLRKTIQNPLALYTLAVAYNKLSRDEEAANLFETVLKERPDYNTAHQLAYTYRRQGKYMEAVDAYRKAIDLVGDQDKKALEDLYLNLGTAYKQMCRKPEAREAFLKAAELNKKHHEQLAHLVFFRCKSTAAR